jgi:hypothetical protein
MLGATLQYRASPAMLYPFTAESLAFAPDGRIVMLDEYGNVFQARPSAGAPGGYELDPEPFLRLSVGRPLGAQYDAEGNLYICDTHKARRGVTRGRRCQG